ncbi:MAG TPA: diguanylate cyclase, partial [Solirubrobacteraceae bacterium]
SNRLRTAVRPGDTVARLGGDEFVVICERVDEHAALAVGARVLEAVRLSATAAHAQHELSASIGVALGHGDAAELLAEADAAVYRAKAAGRGRVELFR